MSLPEHANKTIERLRKRIERLEAERDAYREGFIGVVNRNIATAMTPKGEKLWDYTRQANEIVDAEARKLLANGEEGK